MDIFDGLTTGTRLELRHIIPERGNIYDRYGNSLASHQESAILLFAARQRISDTTECYDALSRILRRTRNDLETQFGQYLPETVFLVDKIDFETYQREEQILQQACNMETQSWTGRFYHGELAPHLVGYIGQIPREQLPYYQSLGYPQDALVGRAGIEQAFEQQLAGMIGNQLIIVAPTGEIIRQIVDRPAIAGQDVFLTVDRNLQSAVQLALIEAYNHSRATWAATSQGAAAVVMDVRTGEILAMASYPWFDPSVFNPESPLSQPIELNRIHNTITTPLLNRAIQGQYPAGSVAKIASMAAGLENRSIDAGSTYTCTGHWNGGQHGDVLDVRTDWKLDGHGTISFQEALTHSCNSYFWELGLQLHRTNPSMLPTTMRHMGLGIPTGQEILPENMGAIPDPSERFQSWELGDTLNLVIGQGTMQVTPLQVTRMVSAVANEGSLLAPVFVRPPQPLSNDTFISPMSHLEFTTGTFQTIQQAMCDVTLATDGTARGVFEDWYEFQGHDIVVCGKTGTAESGDVNSPPHSWFTAYAPQHTPEIAITVIVENSCEGSEVAAPIVRRIVEDFYGLPRTDWPTFWNHACQLTGE
jgi:penicillin-binding protein 2